MRTARRPAWQHAAAGALALVALVVLLGACGGASPAREDAAVGAEPPATGEPGGAGAGIASALPDACGLVDAAAIQDLVGVALPATAAGGGEPGTGPVASLCTWADLAASPTLVGLQVYRLDPAVPVDPISLVAQSSQARTAIAIGDGGEVLADVGLIPGGGGVGRSIIFRAGDRSIALGATGGDVDPAKLEAIARAVADRL